MFRKKNPARGKKSPGQEHVHAPLPRVVYRAELQLHQTIIVCSDPECAMIQDGLQWRKP
jgi:hypothetical protein